MTQPTTLLLPGLLCDEAVWSHQRAALSAVAPCVVPAYGLSDSIAGMARVALDAAPTGPLAVVGHSMGGRVALEIVRQVPERVQRLALLDTGVDPIADNGAGAQERAQRLALLQVAKTTGMRAMGRQWARGMVHPDRVESPLFDTVLDMIERQTPAVFEAQINALLGRPDARPVLAAVLCPTLLLCGRQDAWSPLARHERMQQLLPHARLVVVEDAGHMTTMEQPDAVSRLLLEWLRA